MFACSLQTEGNFKGNLSSFFNQNPEDKLLINEVSLYVLILVNFLYKYLILLLGPLSQLEVKNQRT